MMAVPCNKEYEIGEITANQERILDDLKDLKECVRDVKKDMSAMQLKIAGISSAISLFAYLIFKAAGGFLGNTIKF